MNPTQGDSSSMQATVPNQTTTNTTSIEGGGEGGGDGAIGSILASGVDESDQNLMGNYSGNRWPRQETLALLEIRSDMESIFRDSTHKGPLWEEVSRKLAELGYHRTPKKCREKFENVYKYYKRTREGRTGKSEGKTYRFFDQLEAFDGIQLPSHSTSLPLPLPLPLPPQPQQQNPQTQITTTTTTATMPVTTGNLPNPIVTSNINAQTPQPTNPPSPIQDLSMHLSLNSTSSSTASDEELEGGSRKRKKKWKEFFKRLTKDVLKKQEELQKRFLVAVERQERERITREEAWRTQEMARINREHEILIQERSASAAKDAAIITFLQKLSGQEITPVQTQYNPTTQPQPPPPPPPPPPSSALTQPTQVQPITTSLQPTNTMSLEYAIPRRDNGDNANVGTSSSRWPKAEVHALIKIRTNLDIKYQHNGPKGPLWEEISAEMLKLGYIRSAKRCKEKWENINKYFKKVKESNKRRREDAKTCPYYHQLDALYKEKSLSIESSTNVGSIHRPIGEMETLVVTPEQQWPPVQAPGFQGKNAENMIKGGGEDEEEEEETEEDDEEGEFEVVPNKGGVVSHGNGE